MVLCRQGDDTIVTHRRHTQDGFTVLEVLIVVGVIILLGLMIYFMQSS